MASERSKRADRKSQEPPSPGDGGSSAEGAYRAAVTLNDALVRIGEELGDAQRLDHLPLSLRSHVQYLAQEVAKLQGVTEWVTERLVRLVPDEELGDEDEAEPTSAPKGE